jgi:hypothetical protein
MPFLFSAVIFAASPRRNGFPNAWRFPGGGAFDCNAQSFSARGPLTDPRSPLADPPRASLTRTRLADPHAHR